MNHCTLHPRKSALLITLAAIFGVVFLLTGIAGFIPALSPNGLLLGIFNVDPLHSAVHVVTGIIFLWCAATSARASQFIFRLFGIVYTIIAIIGFFTVEKPVLNVLSNNLPVAWLHLVLGIIALVIGFCTCCKKCKHDDIQPTDTHKDI